MSFIKAIACQFSLISPSKISKGCKLGLFTLSCLFYSCFFIQNITQRYNFFSYLFQSTILSSSGSKMLFNLSTGKFLISMTDFHFTSDKNLVHLFRVKLPPLFSKFFQFSIAHWST